LAQKIAKPAAQRSSSPHSGSQHASTRALAVALAAWGVGRSTVPPPPLSQPAVRSDKPSPPNPRTTPPPAKCELAEGQKPGLGLFPQAMGSV
jgi:hypothetical protein